MIHILTSHATEKQVAEMLEELGDYIKLAVDIRRGIIAGGGALHADCEEILLIEGSDQEDIWGADWEPSIQQLKFGALINIRPGQNNPSMEILDPNIRARLSEIVSNLFGNI